MALSARRLDSAGCGLRSRGLPGLSAVALLAAWVLQPAAPAVTLRGTVTWGDGAPAAGLRVEVHRVHGDGETPDALAGAVQTDAGGRFAIQVGPVFGVLYRLLLQDGNGRLLAAYGTNWIDGDIDCGAIVLTPAELHGIVRGPDGRPVADAEVVLEIAPRPGRDKGQRFVEARRLRTGPDGLFAAAGLVADDYRYDITAAGCAPDHGALTLMPTGQRLEVQLEREARILGRVVDESGHPVAGAPVHVWDGQQVTTAADGTFVVAGLGEADSYGLGVEADGYYVPREQASVSCKPGADTSLTIVLARAGVLEVRLEPEGPAAVLPAALTVWLRERGSGDPWKLTEAVRAGAARYAHVRPDVYSLETRGKGVPLLRAKALQVRAGETTVVALRWPVVHTLSGKVTDDQGRPLAGFWVDACSIEDRGAGQHAWSDENGEFAVAGLPRGRYELEIKEEWSHDQYPHGHWDVSVGGDGDRLTGLTLVLPAGLAVRGRVVTPDGDPVLGVFITGYSFPVGPEPWPKPYFLAIRNAKSAADGRFTLTGLPRGTCRLSASYSESWSRPPDVVVEAAAGGPEVAVTIQSAPATVATGVVVDEAGKPVADARAQAHWFILDQRPTPPIAHECRTGADGRFSVPALRRDWPRLTVTKDGYLTEVRDRPPPDAPPGVPDLTVILRRGHRVSGTVVRAADGRPAAGVLVLPVLADAQGGLFLYEREGEDRPILPTDAEGRFSFGGVPRGLVTLPFGKVVAVGDADVADVQIELPVTGTIGGRVLDGNGRPLGRGLVEAVPMGVTTTAGIAPREFLQGDGRFVWDQVPVGRYLLLWRAVGEGGPASPAPVEVTVRPDTTVEVELGLGPRPDDPVVNGVLLAPGLTADSGEIRLFHRSPRWQRCAEEVAFCNPTTAAVGRDGRFAAHALRPGTYAFAYKLTGPAVEPDGVVAQGTGTVEIDETQRELRLEVAAVDMSGTVTTAAGAPASGAGLELMPLPAAGLRPNLARRGAHTDDGGQYVFRGVRPGRYHLVVRFKDKNAVRHESRSLLDIAVTATGTRFDVRLAPAVQLTGHAADADGRPLAGVCILVPDWGDHGDLEYAATWADGAYEFEYPLEARDACPVYAVAEGYATEAALVRLAGRTRHDVRLVPGGDVLVTVRRRGQPVPDQVVQVFDATGTRVLRDPGVSWANSDKDRYPMHRCLLLPTDLDGQTMVYGLHTGRYTVRLPGHAESATVEVRALGRAEAVLELADE